jgi:hypothetical protein
MHGCLLDKLANGSADCSTDRASYRSGCSSRSARYGASDRPCKSTGCSMHRYYTPVKTAFNSAQLR